MAPLWRDEELKRRFLGLVEYLAKRYNNEPLVEGIIFKGESATGVDANAGDPTWATGPFPTSALDKLYDFSVESMIRWRQHAPRKMVLHGNNYWGTSNTGIITARIQKFIDAFDRYGGMGWGWPDSFNNGTSNWPPQPATAVLARASGWVHSFSPTRINRYAMFAETQLSNHSRCTRGPADCWDVISNPNYRHQTQEFNPQLMVPNPPVNGYQGMAGTHAFWNPHEPSPHDEPGVRAMLDSKNWAVFSTHCPRSFTENGFTCVTGEK